MIIRCIDFETTGIPTPEDAHAIVEIGWADMECDDADQVQIGGENSFLCNPGRTIPFEAMAVHHITNEMVKDAFGNVGMISDPPDDYAAIDYFAAHNADYERQFFKTDVPFICTFKVAVRVWPDLASHSLQYLRYALNFGVDIPSPHRAGPDAYLCAILLAKIFEAKPDLSIDDMVRWSNGPALLPRCPIGKHRGKAWDDVPTDYLEWIVYKAGDDMDKNVKANAKHHLIKRSQS